jgi:di/tricarboxylate transporter
VTWETLQIILVLALTAVVFFGMIKEYISPEVLALAAVALLLGLAVIKTQDFLKVFSNSAPFTVACLFILSAALERTGVINTMGLAMSRIPWRSWEHALLVMMLGVAVLSAFVNNTPIVVIMTPVAIQLAHALSIPASRLLMPLSFATILGGTCSLIGTSTNIIVDGVTQAAGLQPFGLFEITAPGIIMAAAGITYYFLIGRRLLPDRQMLSDTLVDLSQRKFLTEIVVPQGSPLIGKTLGDAGLSRKRGHYVMDLIRDEGSFHPEFGEPKLQAGDRLVLRTSVAEFMELRDAGEVAAAAASHALEPISTRGVRMMEGIIGPRSTFVGSRVADLNLRRLYQTYILAIHRQNENLHADFEGVHLQFGDTLLLEGPPEGLKRLFERQELINLTEVTAKPFRRNKAWIAILAVGLVIGLSAFEALPIAATSMIAAVAVIVFRCLEPEEAYNAIQWPLLMLIFAMLALGGAMQTTGAIDIIVDAMVRMIGNLGPAAVLSAIYLLTSILNAFVSNNAAAILFTPIAIGLAGQMGVDPRPFVAAIMFASSADFSTPIGYQTNTFVYAAGGYKFLDFTKVGLPLNLLLLVIASFIIPIFWPLTPVAAR